MYINTDYNGFKVWLYFFFLSMLCKCKSVDLKGIMELYNSLYLTLVSFSLQLSHGILLGVVGTDVALRELMKLAPRYKVNHM